MSLQDIVDLLEDENFGEPGVNLFRESMPVEVESGLLVTAQMPADIDKYAKHRTGSFQIIARGRYHDEVREIMEKVSSYLTIDGHTGADDRYYHFILPRHEPLIYPKSDANYVEASVNFDFAYNA